MSDQQRLNGLRVSRAALVDRYRCRAECRSQNATDLAAAAAPAIALGRAPHQMNRGFITTGRSGSRWRIPRSATATSSRSLRAVLLVRQTRYDSLHARCYFLTAYMVLPLAIPAS